MENSSKKDNGILHTVLIIMAIVSVLAIFDNIAKRIRIRELEKEIDENDDFNEEIKKKLKELIEKNKDTNPQVSNELNQVAELIKIKQEEKAVSSLAKIIENLLKELYQNTPDFKSKCNKKDPTFHDYLEYARNIGVISREDYHLVSVIKIVRNEEAHELNVKKEKGQIIGLLLASFGIILCLGGLLRERSVEKEPKKDIPKEDASL